MEQYNINLKLLWSDHNVIHKICCKHANNNKIGISVSWAHIEGNRLVITYEAMSFNNHTTEERTIFISRIITEKSKYFDILKKYREE